MALPPTEVPRGMVRGLQMSPRERVAEPAALGARAARAARPVTAAAAGRPQVETTVQVEPPARALVGAQSVEEREEGAPPSAETPVVEPAAQVRGVELALGERAVAWARAAPPVRAA